MTKKFSVTIAGNMGAGKSTLTQLLAEDLNWTPIYEAVDGNPYLSDFSRDMARWSFQSQVYFLCQRLRVQREMAHYPQPVVQDRGVFEDAEIFARNLHQRGEMSARDYQVYRELYDEFMKIVSKPDLIVYLKASLPTLIGRIRRRGRDYERNVSPLYLQQLNELYNAWIDDFTLCPVLIIDADRIDFVKSRADYLKIKRQILAQLQPEPVYA